MLHCKNCGEWRSECLQFHHRDPKQKEFNVSEWIRNGVSLETLRAEIAKCAVLCANCHAIETQNQKYRKLGPHISNFKSRWSESNRRPAVYKTAALPLSYIGIAIIYHNCQEYRRGATAVFGHDHA